MKGRNKENRFSVALSLCRNVGALRSLDLTSHLHNTRWVASALAPEAKKKVFRCVQALRAKDVGLPRGPSGPLGRSKGSHSRVPWLRGSIASGRTQVFRPDEVSAHVSGPDCFTTPRLCTQEHMGCRPKEPNRRSISNGPPSQILAAM